MFVCPKVCSIGSTVLTWRLSARKRAGTETASKAPTEKRSKPEKVATLQTDNTTNKQRVVPSRPKVDDDEDDDDVSSLSEGNSGEENADEGEGGLVDSGDEDLASLRPSQLAIHLRQEVDFHIDNVKREPD